MADAALVEIFRRDRTVVGVALAIITAVTWTYLLWLSHEMASTSMGGNMPMSGMQGMDSMAAPAIRPWSLSDFAFVFVMWTIMMVGMMTPSAAPMILIYANVGRQAMQQGRPFPAVGWFTAGYLLAWTGFSLLATVSQWALTRAAMLTPGMQTASGLIGGLLLIAAGIYQWTPVKDICLKHCQSPLIFIQRHGGFRRDIAGSLSMGLRHGLYCVGCCWALMLLLFVGGVMNVLWIAALAMLVLIEKVGSSGRIFSRAVGVVLLLAGVWTILQ
ncbi:MAG TPA: DUF2182 domain-containing protein [Pseudolabrys sp.]|nr:DUF2182 domain-containing protein [Pseudolabrys sp.]